MTLGVNLLTFDSLEELDKLLKLFPNANLLLRINTDDSKSLNQLSEKFGASLEESYEILDDGFDSNKILKEGWIFNHLHSRNYQVVTYPSLLWGPTCDSGDKIIDEILLPDMQTGDFISVKNMGAYTKSLETTFNGIP